MLPDIVDGKVDSEMQEVAAIIEKQPNLQAQVEAMSGGNFNDRNSSANGLAKPEDADSAPIQLLANDSSLPGYEILRELGRGGMGIVYLAKNVNMGDRLEVLKVLNERLVSVSEAKERFLREISSIAKLSHPSIVTAYSVLPVPSMVVFAMEYVQGVDLAKFILKNHPLPIHLACAFAQQIAAGLQHGFERDLVHRDIKPSNIMVFKTGNHLSIKILDYGLAKATSEKPSDGLTQQGMMLGTLEYVAPEQMLNAAKSDIRADIYSLGCTLYHMLQGTPPFQGTVREIMMAHAATDAAMLHIVRPDVPIELAAIVAKMMAKEPHRRYAMPSEIIHELKPFLRKQIEFNSNPRPADSPIIPSGDTISIAASADVDTSVNDALSRGEQYLGSTPSKQQFPSTSEASNSKIRSLLQSRLGRIGMIALALTTLGIGGAWSIRLLSFKPSNRSLVKENLPAEADAVADGVIVDLTKSIGKASDEMTPADKTTSDTEAKESENSRSSLSEPSPRKLKMYRVTTYTGNVAFSGTDAYVYITIVGSDGTLRHRELDHPGNDRERGAVDTYVIRTKDLGELKTVRLSLSNWGNQPGWFLDKVIIHDEDDNQTWRFDCHNWLAKDAKDGMTTRTLSAIKLRSK